jgi:hypothetical protein
MQSNILYVAVEKKITLKDKPLKAKSKSERES